MVWYSARHRTTLPYHADITHDRELRSANMGGHQWYGMVLILSVAEVGYFVQYLRSPWQ
jgi:hypothetical protein